MKIENNTVVSLSYELKESKADAETIEKVGADQPLVFMVGHGNLLPKFESNLMGKSKGDSFDFVLKVEDAYGPLDENQIGALPIENFMVDGKIMSDVLVVGSYLNMRNDQDHPLRAKVVAVGEKTVTMDFNHQLAGKDLHFKGEVVELRAATESEIDHGHVHGPGGVEH